MVGLCALMGLVTVDSYSKSGDYFASSVNSAPVRWSVTYTDPGRHWDSGVIAACSPAQYHESSHSVEAVDAYIQLPSGEVKASGLSYGFTRRRTHDETYVVTQQGDKYYVRRETAE